MSNKTHSTVRSLCAAEGLDEELSDELGRFAALLVKHGKKVNLIGTLDAERIARELILDSLELLKVLPESEVPRMLFDIGSGAGIPGIPLLLARPQWEAVLVEPRLKRAGFLNHAVREFQLSDRVSVGQEHWHGGFPQESSRRSERPHLWVSRAVLSPEEWLERATSSAAPGDEIVVWTNGSSNDVPLDPAACATRTYGFGEGRERTIRVYRVE